MKNCKNCHRFRPSKTPEQISRYGAENGTCYSAYICEGGDDTEASPYSNGAVYLGIGGKSKFIVGPEFGCINFVPLSNDERTTQTSVVSEKMLAAAMKKACETGLFPAGQVCTDEYIKNWDRMKALLQAALDAEINN